MGNVVTKRFNGVCDISVIGEITDEYNLTHKGFFPEQKNVECRLVVENAPAATITEGAAAVSQTITLLLPPDVRITAGSRVMVTQEGATDEYRCAGMPVRYSKHQEVSLTALKGWT